MLKFIPLLDTTLDEVGNLSPEIKEMCQGALEWQKTVGFRPPWIGYVALNDGECVGLCGYKSPPRNHEVEIAYGTFTPYQGKGVGTAMAHYLVKLARDSEPGIKVIAQTLPGKNASGSILTKVGFSKAGTVDHPEDGLVWQWELATDKPATLLEVS